MFTIAKIRNGETYLDHHLSANDYYTEKESVEGVWTGRGAERLGIHGQTIAAGDRYFENFRNNLTPDGKRLTERGGETRIRFLDIQCGAPKSVSIQAITLGDFRLQGAHQRAVNTAYAELEKFAACQNNTLTERQNRLTGNLITARFAHTASRELDPQLHDHLVTVAATFDAQTERWKALTEYEIFKAVRYCGKVYQNELAKECRRLGYDLRPSYDNRKRVCGFELAGVSDDLVKRYSKRRAQIERGIEHFKREHGREPSTAEIHTITCQTRDPKLKEATTPEVIDAQRGQLTGEELAGLESLKRRAMERSRASAPELRQGLERESLRHAIANNFERTSVAQGHELMAGALNHNLGELDLEKLRAAMATDALIRLTSGRDDHGLDATYVTPAGLRRERWVLAAAAKEKGLFPPLAQELGAQGNLSDNQRDAVNGLLACRDRIACLRGAAGTGKTTVLKAVEQSLQDAGREVVYCAPTGAAKEVLKSDGANGATTVAGLLASTAYKPLKTGSILVVDEAGMLSLREGRDLMRHCLTHECRLILVGDTRQHASVEAGDFLRLMEKYGDIHRVELTDIRRQTVSDYRECVKLFAEGRARDGMEKLKATGRIQEHGAEYLIQAAKSYADRAYESGVESVIGVSPTWAEGRAFTDSIRQELRRTGMLSDGVGVTTHQSLGWTDNQRSDLGQYSPGLVLVMTGKSRDFARGESLVVESVTADRLRVRDRENHVRWFKPSRGGFEVCEARTIEVSTGDRLLIQANDPTRGFTNGTLVTVTQATPDKIILSDGRILPPTEFSRFAHGYVVTSHQSQGKTADHVVVAAARLDAKAAYVATSRGRKSCELHTPDRAALMASLPEGDRPLAIEKLPSIPATDTPRHNLRKEEKSLSKLWLQALPGPMPPMAGITTAPSEKSLALKGHSEPTRS